MKRIVFRSVAAVLLSATLSACSGEGALSVRLVSLSLDEPRRDATNLVVEVLNRQLMATTRLVADPSAPTDLGIVGPLDGARVLITGIDAEKRAVARGYSRELNLDDSLDTVEIVPFTSQRVVAALPVTHALDGEVRIDGYLTEWTGAPSTILAEPYRVFGPERKMSALRAEVMFAWSETLLHFALRVIDDCPTLIAGKSTPACPASAKPDRIAIGFDGSDDGGGYGPGDFFVEASATQAVVRSGEGLEATDVPMAFGLPIRGSGWTVEGSVSLKALGRVGFEPTGRCGVEVTIIAEHPGEAEPTVLRLSGSKVPLGTITPIDEMATLGFALP